MTKPAIVDKTEQLHALLAERILVLDGAMGTQIQALGYDERAVRGERFAEHHKDLKNFADILCLTHPDAIRDIHRHYFAAGADIVETNTFGASPLGMEEFDLPLELVRRDQSCGGAVGVRGARRVHRARRRPAAVCGRFDRAHDEADGDQHQRRRSELSRRDVRPDGGLVLRAGGGAGRRGRRHSAARNGDRHAQLEGVLVCDREVL